MLRSRLLTLVLCSLLYPAVAAAQQPPDVVTTRDGGMVRGTIVEKVPGSHVEISLGNGKTRRFAMGQVEYAGPASAAPGAAPAPARSVDSGGIARIHGQQVKLQLRGAGLTFHKRTGTRSAVAYGPGVSAVAYGEQNTELCSAPCEISMPAGTHHLSLSETGSRPVGAGPISITGDATLNGRYESYADARIAGWGIFSGTLAPDLAL